ncbi:hypothetical protein [Paludisphaera rhizosphaerae]|uniref:hypothetical protein n=1 Tax=Paludisphaera rhizosphaerae TaxID=2711216 RepID=UPI001982356B|nr:hypothetical protein [Paludisphaera rhizosphaerae]
MTSFFRTTALVGAIALASGCSGPRHFDRRASEVRLPTAPTLEPSPLNIDPDKVGTVGTPSPPVRSGNVQVPPLQPLGGE